MISQLEALDEALELLTLGDEHKALVAFCRGMAEQIDLFPSRATLWREYRPAVESLIHAGTVEADDGQATVLELMRTAVGDSSQAGTGKSGAVDRGGGSSSGPAADAVAAVGGGRGRGTSA